MTMKKPTTKKAQPTEGKAVVYIGPTLGGGALMRNAVFRAGGVSSAHRIDARKE